MSENYFVKLVKQISMYLSSDILVVLASIITYPIWTRVFTEAEYGHMSIATSTVAILLGFSKFGIQHAALRFYSEFNEHKRNLDITYYYTTTLVSIFFISFAIAFGFIAFIELFYSNNLDIQYLKVLRILPFLIIFGAINTIFFMYLRVEQNVKLHSVLGILYRYLTIAANLLFALVFKLGLIGFFWGCALAEVLFSVFFLIKFFLQKKINLKTVSLPLVKESISYGLPLLGFEIAYLLLASGDRFLIQHFLGAAAVGIYSASYGLTNYLVEFFANPFQLAVMPLFISVWEKSGREETEKFLFSMSRFYFMIGIPIIFAVSFMGRDFLVLFASEKFEQGYVIMPFIIIGFVLYKANFLYGAGLYLKKKTNILLVIGFSSVAINLGLNVVLTPRLYLYGPAIAALVAYSVQVILLIAVSYRTVRFKLPIDMLFKSVAISIIMVIAILNINNLGTAQIFVRVGVGLLVYVSGILLLEAQIRFKAKLLFHRIFAR